jgi:hypothetical protein
MKLLTPALFVFCLIPVLLPAQKSGGLEGLWKGSMTLGGLDDQRQVTFELYLTRENKKLVGKSYLYLSDDRVIEMEVRGTLYGDLSIYLQDKEFIPEPGSEEKPPYYRKYQLMYMPSIWNTKMEGFWQEVTPHYFSEKRRLGRIKLKKMKDPTRA